MNLTVLKKKPKNTISNYDELLLVKKELRSKIMDHEDSFAKDITLVSNAIKVFKISISKKRTKKDERLIKQSLRLLIDDMLVYILQPFAKNNKQEQLFVPIVSTVLSYLIADKIGSKSKGSGNIK